MDEQPNDASGGRPSFLGGTTGMIGGITALVVALGGLATATREMWRSEPKAQAATVEKAADTANSPAAKASTSYTIDDGSTLKRVQGMWVLTVPDEEEGPQTYRYSEEFNDGTTIVAVMRKGGEDDADVWMRWPVKGGQVSESQNDQENWTDLGEAKVVEAANS